MDKLKNKTAIITGASSGIGRVTAELFAAEGANLVLAARRTAPLEETLAAVKAMGARAVTVSADVSKEEDCAAICDAAAKEFGAIDILVNNAGIVDKHRPITRCDADWWHKICAVDLDSVYYMCRCALPHMERSEQASIVNISSIGGVFGSSGAAYSAAKAAVLGLTKNIAIQYAGKNIRCNAVCPGPTPTSLNTPEKVATFDQEFAAVCSRHMDPSLPEATPMAQAQAILFFASPDSMFITGQSLIVDNGMTL